LKLSRRDFIHAGCTAGLISLAPSIAEARFPRGAAAPAVVAGLTQAGLSAIFGGSHDYPTIDILRVTGQTWQAFLSPSADPYQYLSSNGYPNAIPAGATQWRLINNAARLPASDPVNGNFVIDWTGGPATIDVVFNVNQTLISTTAVPSSAGRIVYNVTSGVVPVGGQILAQVNITTCTGQITRVRCFPLAKEALLATQQWDQTFLDFYKVYGRVRFMDWFQTNSNAQIKWAHRTLPTQFSQAGWNINTLFYCGLSTKSNGDYTTLNRCPSQADGTAGNPTSWVHGQMIQTNIPTAPVEVAVQSVTLGATTTINANSHGFSNGNLVQFITGTGGGSGVGATNQMLGIGAPVFTVSGVTANSFNLSGINSSTWNGTSGGAVYHAIRVSDGFLPMKPVAGGDGSVLFSGVIRSGYPATFVYDEDFDRLLFSTAPNGAGEGIPLGMAFETQVDLANKLGPLVQPWFCLPHGADDDYATACLTYIRDNLDPTITFCFELSNEVWNIAAGFIQSQNYAEKGKLRWPAATDSFDAMYSYYGYRVRAVMAIAATVFSGQMHRIIRIMGEHATDALVGVNPYLTARHRCSLEGYLSGDWPVNYCDQLAYATYYNFEQTVDAQQVWNIVYGDSGERAIGLANFDSRMRSESAGQGSLNYYIGQTTGAPFSNTSGQNFNWNAQAVAYGKTFSAYEGGPNNLQVGGVPAITNNPPPSAPGTPITSADVALAYKAYQFSALFAQFTTDATLAFISAGVVFPAQYCVVNGEWSGGNPFALKEPTIDAADTPVYTAWRVLNGR
jgi:hypothetical protein